MPAEPIRERILKAALERFQHFGFKRTSMADMARDVGVVPGTLYRYFDNKEALFREVVGLIDRAWLARAQEVLAEPGTAFERLTRLGWASVVFNRENFLAGSILQRDAEFVCPALLEEAHDLSLDSTVRELAKIIRDGIETGEFREMDPEKAALLLFLTGQALYNQTRYDYAEMLQVMLDVTRHGLLRKA